METKKAKRYNRIIIGAGIYGLYAALQCGMRGESILILEYESMPFARATYVNQARLHMGYHYPRSLSTAKKSASYYRRFQEEFAFAINDIFKQIYATSAKFSWTNAEAFQRFCQVAQIKCEEVSSSIYFNPEMCDGVFLAEEGTYDAALIRGYYINALKKYKNIDIQYGTRIQKIVHTSDEYMLIYNVDDNSYEAASSFVLNATYASVNQIMDKVEDTFGVKDEGIQKFKIKYEQCEIVICSVDDSLKDVGLTIMDGPFFSIMPFGKTGYHSLTSVTFTPHITSYDELPTFYCQNGTACSPAQLENCNTCEHKPASAWDHMSRLAMKYMKPAYGFTYETSLYSMKPILKSSEVDDSRPTAIRVHSKNPTMISVLSGKINTIYDLDEFLES